MAIKAIGFDIDGTVYKAFDLYKKLIGKSFVRLPFLFAFNSVRHDLRKLLKSSEFRSLSINNHDKFHQFQAELTAKKLGKNPQEVRKMIDDFFYTQTVNPFSEVPLYPNVPEVLDSFRKLGLKVGALSDFPVERKLKLMGLYDKFDVKMSSEEIGLVKPDTASFKLMAKNLGVECNEVLYVGNSEKYDIEGSLQAGMRAALISKSRIAAKKTKAEFVFHDYNALLEYVKTICI